MIKITIAAVGDLLMKSEIIAAAKQTNGYTFDPIFAKVKPYLTAHDLTIGNLETTFSGKRKLGAARIRLKCNCPRERINPKTGYPVFNCPDELASTLKKTGFHVVTTANNHCVDGGVSGLKRTLNVLDKYGLKHTGTSRSVKEANRHLIMRVKGVNIGILAYTKGTNAIPVPSRWLVNQFDQKKMAADIHDLKKQTDFIIVCLHFGKEYQTYPSKDQKKWMQFLFRQGVNVVLGAHPHVLHPITQTVVKDIHGQARTRVAASSLGNFVSTKLIKHTNTIRGMILSLTLSKSKSGITDIIKVGRIPTMVERKKAKKTVFTVVPVG
ncbi:poly-gamma-glutamate synthesis protein (capsule biosynthesis protein) [Paenibacillus sp. yr247]|uniref:CapA family protein n=1 Tax=Paenibacillus sp. yr247 TaxID=1761880 RepID=UPI000888C9C8|nr:CapA family protein [Paenibacillus sp. yr247]SDN40225.1 poly-gamma-glutamate synthesis protein (capsule biosynthesis protein) [Paenibacillus sp. yr247]